MDAAAVHAALEKQRKAEQAFVDRVRQNEKAPVGWPAALVLFHIGMWRERMRDSLTAALEGRDYALPGTADEINERELAAGIGTPLGDAAARADHLLTEIDSLFDKAIDKPVQWFASANATEAILRNSYSHPRSHIVEYLAENGEIDAAREMLDEGLEELEDISASDYAKAALTRLRGDSRFEEQVTT